MKPRFLIFAASLAAACAQAQIQVVMDARQRAQTIENFGASTGMHGDHIARHWNPATLDAIAELLMDREKGIGLSCFRIQIGAGTIGEAGGIRTPYRRTECVLQPDGTYDWNKDAGVRWWRRKAAEYGLPTVIGYLNSPPVQFTENGFGFKTNKVFSANLKPEHYDDYAEFLARVALHYQQQGLPFTHISPVNEPQWSWDGVPGQAKQEGSPWTNEQVARLVRLADARFRSNKVSAKLLVPEAADYHALYEPMPERPFAAATDQIRAFWQPGSPYFVGRLASVESRVAGHAYFNDGSIDQMLRTRMAVREAIGKTDPDLRFWQTEYCLLGKAWTGGLPLDEVDETVAALLVARNIHVDLTVANATAWQWWTSTEPEVGSVPRYYLIEADAKGAETYRATKLLWALGHYSRFVRPGMVRIAAETGLPPRRALEGIMVSAFLDPASGGWVLVAINFSAEAQRLDIKTAQPSGTSACRAWLTDAERDMAPVALDGPQLSLPPRSIATVVSGRRK